MSLTMPALGEDAMREDPNAGLSDAEARAKLEAAGPNEPVVGRTRSVVVQILRRFTNPLVAILLLAATASAVTQNLGDAAVIVAIVLVSVAIELGQTRRAETAAARLKSRVASTATVLRDGRWQERPRTEIVVGDLVRLSAGEIVPGDGRVVEAKDLHVNEAALTGESLPLEKQPGAAVLMGAAIVSGTATARVTATGGRTQFGDIVKSLARKPPPTEFERGIVRFGVFILKTVAFLVMFVFATVALVRHDVLEALLFAVALAVGLTPEFLPMITTVTLARGAVRMSHANVIVKNLAAIQNFGSIDILCCDKTGTITTGVMTLEEHVDPLGAPSERPLLLAYLNSFFESGVENPLDAAVLRHGKIDPIDAAVLRHDHPDITGYRKVDEIPFDFERRRVSIVATRGKDDLLLVTKGAPEHVLAIASSCEIEDRVVPLHDDLRECVARVFRDLGAKGYRVIGIAYRTEDLGHPLTVADEHDLVLAGWIALVDPPRADTAEVIADLRRQGIDVKILSGDNEQVAAHVCARVGLSIENLIHGRALEGLTDPALAHHAERAAVFARLTPAQKTRIVRALQSRGHVVGFLGDGINDAPSLHAADVGISVSEATDVAKDAAAIILLEPGLRVLLTGVLEGRRAFGNVMKYLLMGTSSNFGNMFSMAGAAVLMPFLPMLPKQILLNSFLYDVAQITIPSDDVDPRYLRKPRHWDIDLVRRFMIWLGPISSAYDFLTFFVLLHLFHASPATFHTGWFVESLATQTLVIFVIRTGGSALRSRPSRALMISTIGVVLTGLALPISPLAGVFGFVPLPWTYLLFLIPAAATYLVIVEVAKRRLLRDER